MSEDFVGWSNDLTQGWVDRQGSESSFVLSGAGAWALLAALARGAHGDAKNELEAVVGAVGDQAADQLNGLLEVLSSSEGMTSAIGIWTSPQARIRPEFAEEFPILTLGQIPTDLTELDVWVERETNGILTTFPGTVTAETVFVVSTALAAQAEWTSPFTPSHGSWRGSDPTDWLARRSGDLGAASIIRAEPAAVGRVVCETTGAFDVHLLTGDARLPPADVLTVGLRALDRDGRVSVDDGAALEVGSGAGCLKVVDRPARGPEVSLSLAPFEISGEWDLTRDADLFGLHSAMDQTTGHFERMSDSPLAVDQATQLATAGFSADGFRAAAASSVMMTRSASRQPPDTFKVIEVNLDQPFGFLVVHRDTRLALFAGWVAQP